MYILKNSVNKVALTLTEKAVNADSEFLLKFYNETTGGVKVVAVDDISQYPLRSNVFLVTENITEDLSNGTVYLSPVGQWSYWAYEMAPSSPRNLNVADALKIVEEGICEVKGEDASLGIFTEDEDKNNPVFEG